MTTQYSTNLRQQLGPSPLQHSVNRSRPYLATSNNPSSGNIYPLNKNPKWSGCHNGQRQNLPTPSLVSSNGSRPQGSRALTWHTTPKYIARSKRRTTDSITLRIKWFNRILLNSIPASIPSPVTQAPLKLHPCLHFMSCRLPIRLFFHARKWSRRCRWKCHSWLFLPSRIPIHVPHIRHVWVSLARLLPATPYQDRHLPSPSYSRARQLLFTKLCSCIWERKQRCRLREYRRRRLSRRMLP
jgi:hypothetical protein